MKGEVKALPLSEKIGLIGHGSRITLSREKGSSESKVVRGVKQLNRFLVISFEGITDKDTASHYRNALIYSEEGSLALNEGEYYVDQIVGLSVVNEAGIHFGSVSDIIETGGNDVYVVRNGRKEYLIPAVREVILKIDLDKGEMTIRPLEGLFD